MKRKQMIETESKIAKVKLKDAIEIALAKDKSKRWEIHNPNKENVRLPSDIVIEQLRKEFETLRKQKIEAVAHKHKGDPLLFDDCYRHLMDEVRELDSIVLGTTDNPSSLERNLIEEELIDVANCAEFTFVALKLRRLIRE